MKKKPSTKKPPARPKRTEQLKIALFASELAELEAGFAETKDTSLTTWARRVLRDEAERLRAKKQG